MLVGFIILSITWKILKQVVVGTSIGGAEENITWPCSELTMYCNLFCVLDEGIPSSYLDSDGVGSLCKECERDAAIQGDERL